MLLQIKYTYMCNGICELTWPRFFFTKNWFPTVKNDKTSFCIWFGYSRHHSAFFGCIWFEKGFKSGQMVARAPESYTEGTFIIFNHVRKSNFCTKILIKLRPLATVRASFLSIKIGLTTESDMGVAQGYTNFQKSLCTTIIHVKLSSILFYTNLHAIAQQGMQISSDSMGHLLLNLQLYFQNDLFPRNSKWKNMFSQMSYYC